MRNNFDAEGAALLRLRNNAQVALFLAGRAVVADHFNYQLPHLDISVAYNDFLDLLPPVSQTREHGELTRSERAQIFRGGVLALAGKCAAEPYCLEFGLDDGRSDAFARAFWLSGGLRIHSNNCMSRMILRARELTQERYKKRILKIACTLLDQGQIDGIAFRQICELTPCVS